MKIMNNALLIPLIGYLLFVFALALMAQYGKKKPQQANRQFINDYFLGERSMNGFVLAMTMTATYVSASSFIGGPAAAYQYGLGWVLLALIQVPAILLSLAILGKKFAILARRYQAVTLNDMLYARYQSRLLTTFASLGLLIAFMGAMTVQFIGGARLLESVTGLPYQSGLLLFGLVTALYTAIGGFRGSVLNDALQGCIMLVGTLLLLFAVIKQAGGVQHAVQTLATINPQLITPYGEHHFITGHLMASFWVLVCFAVVGLPHTAARCLAYKDSKALHQGMIIGTVVITLLMLGMHLAGALGRALIPQLAITDLAIPTLMQKVLSPTAAGIFLAAPLSAIMSTINAQLLQSSATLVNDLYLKLRPQAIERPRHIQWLARSVTFLLAIGLILAAWHPPQMLIWLNLLAFGGLEALFLWPLVLGLYWPKANAQGALASMLTGSISYALLASFSINLAGFHPIVPSLLVSLLAFIIVNSLANSSLSTTLNHENVS